MNPKRGAPTKAPGGLDRVLFVRVTVDLLEALDAVMEVKKKTRPTISRSDVAREMLYAELGIRPPKMERRAKKSRKPKEGQA